MTRRRIPTWWLDLYHGKTPCSWRRAQKTRRALDDRRATLRLLAEVVDTPAGSPSTPPR